MLLQGNRLTSGASYTSSSPPSPDRLTLHVLHTCSFLHPYFFLILSSIVFKDVLFTGTHWHFYFSCCKVTSTGVGKGACHFARKFLQFFLSLHSEAKIIARPWVNIFCNLLPCHTLPLAFLGIVKMKEVPTGTLE